VTTPVAEIALSQGEAKFETNGRAVRVNGRTESLKCELNEAHYHSVTFAGLQPKTKYLYRVGDEQKHWSEWFQFETASAEAEPFGFIYFGDAQNDIKSKWSRVARGAFSDMPKAKFIIHAGDLINNRDDDAQWGEWHTAAGWINGMVPSLPTPGNHEYRPLDPHWRVQFTLPENGPPGLEETCYFLDYQGVRFISLNTEEMLEEQTPWLDRILTHRPPSIRWVIVTLHRPLYATMKYRDNVDVRESWRPVFDKHGVDLVLQGHDHSYGRSGLMRDDNTMTGTQVQNERGTVYVVSVSGPKMYVVGEEPWMLQRGEGIQLYQLIHIDGDVLKYESRTARGDLFDAFELRKQEHGINRLVESDAPQLKNRGKDSSRPFWNAVGGAVILALVALGIAWASRSASRRG
jgi:3',5'-cyclic AMP phosphodiesterase CpdA